MAKPVLRVAGEHDSPVTPTSITDALDAGPREVLASMRYALAKKLDAGDVSSNAIASAYKELRELDRQIRAIDAADQEEQRRGSSDGPRRSFRASAI
jgi:hypothetical protein